MMINLNKTYRTRDGQAVKLYAVDIDNLLSGWVVGSVDQTVVTWNMDGRHFTDNTSPLDLIEVKETVRRVGWVNIYNSDMGVLHNSKSKAEEYRDNTCLACVKVEVDYIEGEGLVKT